MRRLALLIGCTLPLIPGPARAQGEIQETELDRPIDPPPDLSTELLDPLGFTRFHLITQGTFADAAGSKTFTNNSYWSMEAQGHVRIIEGIALSFGVPIGISAPHDLKNKFFIGNVSAGVAGGGRFLLDTEHADRRGATVLRLGAAFDVYAPTAPKPGATDANLLQGELILAGMRAYEPWIYLSNQMAMRGRIHADLSVSVLTFEVEGGLTPAFTLTSNSSFLLWASGAGRIVLRASETVEPYVEGFAAVQISGSGPQVTVAGMTVTSSSFSPPFMLTPGLRFHIAGFDPAIFASMNFVHSAVVIFGIDIAGAARKTRGDLSEDIFHGFD